MTLPTLPVKLVNVVVQSLIPRSLKDLDSLAQSCRRLHDVVNPTLHRHYIGHQRGTALLWAAEYGKDAACERIL